MDWRQTFVQAEASALNPVAELMMPPILRAAGLPSVDRKLLLLPRQPALPGRFGEAFGGLVGTIEEEPAGADTNTPGFLGAARIAGTDELLHELDRESGNRVDTRAYLKARLVDLLVGDGDRMPDQWSWAAFDEGGARRWVPVPVRHYQAFSRSSGLVTLTPYLQEFGPNFPNLDQLTESARELDRRILPILSKPEWMAVTAELRAALSDRVISEALRRIPPEMYALEGKGLEQDLLSRRDRLDEVSEKFYRHLARLVEIRASTMDERFSVNRRQDGGIDLSIRRKEGGNATAHDPPLFRRSFIPAETRELRIHTGGGRNEIVVDGTLDRRVIPVRFIDGVGPVRFEDRTEAGRPGSSFNGKTVNYLYDAGPGSVIESGPASAVARRRSQPDPGIPDSGSSINAGLSTAQLNISSDYGAMTGWGVEFEKYGFDEQPGPLRGALDGAIAWGQGVHYRFGASGDIGTLDGSADLHLKAATSTLDNFSYYGSGNLSRPLVAGLDEEDYQTRIRVTTLVASLRYPRSNRDYFWEAGIEAKWVAATPKADSFFEIDRAQVAGRDVDFASNLLFGLHFDSRQSGPEIVLTPRTETGERSGHRAPPNSSALSGMTFDIAGRYYPEGMGNHSAFGKLNSEWRLFVPLNETRFSRIGFRVGGQKNWGEYPYFEAATV